MGGCFSDEVDYHHPSSSYSHSSSTSSSRNQYHYPSRNTSMVAPVNYTGNSKYDNPNNNYSGKSFVSQSSSSTSPSTSASFGSSISNKGTTITREEVKLHTTSKDCWIILYNKVYNVSNFDHPGGIGVLLASGGKDGTNSFKSQHNFDPYKHRTLQKCYIGDLQL